MSSEKLGLTTVKGKQKRGLSGQYVTGKFFSSVKYKANVRNIKFDLTLGYLDSLWLLQRGQCAYTGTPLEMGRKPTASLDRIDSSMGYVPGNVQFVCIDVNMMKWTLSETRFFELIKKIHDKKGLSQI
jgi:hypothetical protein